MTGQRGDRARMLDLEQALLLLGDAVLLEDPSRIVLFANDAFGRVFLQGAPGAAFLGVDCAASARQAAEAFVEVSAWLEATERLVDERVPVRGQVWQLATGGWVERDYLPRFIDGEFAGHSWVYRDVTEREQLRARVADLSRPGSAPKALSRGGTSLMSLSDAPVGRSLILVKVSNLGRINLELGYDAGDEILARIPARIRAAVSDAWVERIGGATFAVVPAGEHGSGAAMQAIREAVSSITAASGQAVLLRVIIGAADNTSADPHLMRVHAQLALDEADATGQVSLYSDALAERDRRNVQMALALPGAIRNGDLSLLYQPIQSLRTGAVVGHEALARWERTGFGTVTAASFVPVAERLGLVQDIDAWVVSTGVAQAASVMKVWGGEAVGLNLSADTVNSRAALVGEVAAALEGSGLAPEQIVIELTETVIAGPSQHGLAALRGLSELGVGIAIDDFGVGASSLGLLRDVPFDYLKLDKSFARGFAEQRVRGLVGRIVDIATDFGAQVIGEGIERREQAETFAELGVASVQGWYIGMPHALPASGS